MKEGFIIKNVTKELNYFGIDACDPDNEPWQYLDEWNICYPNEFILLKEGSLVYKEEYTSKLNKYLKWLKQFKNLSEPHLFFFSNVLKKPSDQAFLNSFWFVGFDCIYVEDEYSDSVLFSTIFNEMKSDTNYSIFLPYIKSLNSNGLFDDPRRAEEYLDFRNQKLKSDEGNLETAWKNINPVVVKVFCFMT